MYGIERIREDLYFWSKTIKNDLDSEKIRKSKIEMDCVVKGIQAQLCEIEYKIRSDINEYYEREQKLKIFKRIRRKIIILKISELEDCLSEVKRKQDELKNYS